MYKKEYEVIENIKNCNFYKNQKKYYGNKLFLEDKTIYFENISNPKNLMVVAHQDDEVIFGGYDLFSNNDFLVIYCTNDNKRINMVKNLAKDKKFNAMIFHHIDSINENILFSKKLYDELKFIIAENNYENIVTHNSIGEYGHIQHILVHQMISNILFETKNKAIFKVFYDDSELNIKNYETKTCIMNKYYNFACDTYQKYYNYKSIIMKPKQYNLEKILFI